MAILLVLGTGNTRSISRFYDTSDPIITLSEEEVFCSQDNAGCDAPVSITITLDDPCAGSEVVVKAFVDGEQVSLGGSYPNFILLEELAIGEHEIEIHAVDGCANSALATKTIQVVDCKVTAPICINGLAVELMPVEIGVDADGDGDEDSGAIAIWATDFKVSGLEDCSGPVKISINRVGETPNSDQTGLILTCDDPDTLAIEVYAWDTADNPTAVQPDGSMGGPNYDFCLTYVLVQDNMFDLCGSGPASIAGLIATEEDETIEEVEVHLSGGMSEMNRTPISGTYAFDNLSVGFDYSVTPIKDNDYLNGVSTFDLVLMTKHILGTRPLDGPYKLIAADVNNSGSITALDLIHLRKLILSISTNFPSNTSWRFVSAAYHFPDTENPWYENFPEVLNYNNLEAAISTGDFIGVKIGDVNGNAQTNSLIPEIRSLAGVFHLQLEEQDLKAGNEYQVNFSSEELANIQGYQFTLNFDAHALELVDMNYGIAEAENFGMTYVEEGRLTSSWNQPGRIIEKGGLFTLILRAKRDARLSDLLSISSRYTQAEAYNAQDELLDVALDFGGKDGRNLEEAFHLYQNQPNPFMEETMIGFYLPKAGEISLMIRDMSGRLLKSG